MFQGTFAGGDNLGYYLVAFWGHFSTFHGCVLGTFEAFWALQTYFGVLGKLRDVPEHHHSVLGCFRAFLWGIRAAF